MFKASKHRDLGEEVALSTDVRLVALLGGKVTPTWFHAQLCPRQNARTTIDNDKDRKEKEGTGKKT